MAIQGTQVTMYTKHTPFLYFSDFSIFFLNFYIKNKINKRKLKINNKNMLNKTKYKRKMQMHESTIPKADKKSSKESPTLDRKN